ncbi:glycoside hydrolase family 16 protein [Nocardioides renjunii]|uniref:glycoside hydrolase family 16 protein n=1 Tax=Nocardioides renjunii TaxID=3095075 RepID=UPI002AFE74E8|nr:glycoside hydrolase family 16 protein [Nocardioides sp. S-34]WQQ21830.1 glycoside hydrolase family 16 protein [Nocardioides sp. S-34]
MSRTSRLVPRTPLRQRLLCGMLAVAFVTAGCSASSSGDAEPPTYETGDGVKARVLPQLAATGEDVEAADDAAWVVDATVAGAEEGTTVRLVAKEEDGWSDVDEQETDAEGHVSLTSRVSGDLHVVVGDGDDAVGAEVSTDEAPEPTFTDDFDEDTVDGVGASWHTRDQGYIDIRTCSRADGSAAEVTDGVLRLSVLEDPERTDDECQLPGRRKKYAYRLNGHVGTEGVMSFTYGYAAARIRTQSARGQHAAFWMQTVGGQKSGGAKKGGAEIDVIEYFGDDHPEGGLTSFTYFLDKSGKKQTVGGWLPDVEQYGDDWAEEYHVFSVEWTPDEYVFRIDGQVTQRLEGETSGQPEFLILSLLSSDYELPRFDGELPQHMDVDWARVWETGPR